MDGSNLALAAVGAAALLGLARRGARALDPERTAHALVPLIWQAWANELELEEGEDPRDVDFSAWDYNFEPALRWVLREAGFRVLGVGGARFAIDLGNGDVLKMNLHPAMYDLSISEVENWRHASKAVRRRMAPLLAWGEVDGFVWEVMPMVDLAEIEDSDLERFGHEWMKLVRDREPGANTEDIGPHNVGRYEDRLVLFDYTSDNL